MDKVDKKIIDLFIQEAFADIELEIFESKTERNKEQKLTINEVTKIIEKIANDYGLKDNELLKLKEMIIHKLF